MKLDVMGVEFCESVSSLTPTNEELVELVTLANLKIDQLVIERNLPQAGWMSDSSQVIIVPE